MMKAGWTTVAAAALLAACAGGPLPAQEDISCNPCWMTRHTHEGEVVEVRMQGSVELTEDDGGVRVVRPGGYLLLVERGTRRPDRRAMYTPGPDRGVRLDFRREGRRQEPDAADRAWIREMLRRAVEDGMNAERRAQAIHQNGGVPALLREVERLDGDGVRQRYYAEAIESSSLRPAEAARVLRHAGREMESEGDLARFLRAFVDRRGDLLADAAVREAFFAAAASLGSDGDRAGADPRAGARGRPGGRFRGRAAVRARHRVRRRQDPRAHPRPPRRAGQPRRGGRVSIHPADHPLGRRPPPGTGPPLRHPLMIRISPLLAALALLLPAAAAAQTPAPAPAAPAAPPKEIRAVRFEGRAPAVDGRLDDAAWAAAPVLSDFVQKQPVEGGEPTERTEVRFVYDDAALYVAARMFKKDPAAIQAPVGRRDDGGQAEHIWISLDTYLDRRTAYSFGVTASGTRMDWYHATDDEGDVDLSFDPVWQAEVQRDSLGWTAEMRIPFSQLRFNAGDVQTWGLNIDRWNPATQEDVFWIPVRSQERAWASRFGTLSGIAGIRPSRRAELLPYVASSGSFSARPGTGNPFDDGSSFDGRIGADFKMGVGPNLTLEGTVNPDFGQVEADPAQVNLSAYEAYFDERRPFFIEGRQLLAGSGPEYFYSRRIGS
ncbi:MAG TPA: DUF5916 domain-containing protein, partial [Longimicrobium sp.]|nr:DUF5916 domain-containing protein [Longimicrobium sp.]